jgi:hypothetical protein
MINPLVWRNPNGTWSHHRDSKRQWADETGCRTDLRFAEEWAAQSNHASMTAIEDRQLKPRFSANVTFEAATPAEIDRISYGLFEAKNEWDAARKVAQWAAVRRYGEHGETGSIARLAHLHFRAAIGLQRRSNGAHGVTLHGCSIVIRLTPKED